MIIGGFDEKFARVKPSIGHLAIWQFENGLGDYARVEDYDSTNQNAVDNISISRSSRSQSPMCTATRRAFDESGKIGKLCLIRQRRTVASNMKNQRDVDDSSSVNMSCGRIGDVHENVIKFDF